MKRADLIRAIEDEGCVFVRAGGRHDIYRNVITGASDAIPRHREINELTARNIIRRLSAPHDPS